MTELSHEDARDMVESIRRLTERFTGSQRDDEDKKMTTRQKFEKGVGRATQGLELMSGSAYSASSALRKVVGFGAFGIAIQSMVDGLTNMSRNFTKLTDVGISFGGSIFQMEKQAADAGLSMEEFARTIEKNSTIVSQMGDTQTQGVKQFSDYQHAVRNNLKEFGYFGASLAQVNDQSSEFAENLRRTGALGQMTDRQQSKAGAEFITQINAMSHATGKSREEILKLTNEAIRDPATAARLSQLGDEASKSAMETAAALSATYGQAGSDIAHMFSETLAAKGRTWATTMGDAAIQVGMPGLNAAMERIAEPGRKPSLELFKDIGRMRDAVGANLDNLITFAKVGGPEAKAGANMWLKFFTETQGYDPVKVFARTQEAEKDKFDGVTQAVQMFQTNLMEITAAFRRGVFKSILEMIAPGKDAKEKGIEFQKVLDNIKDVMKDLGSIVGDVVGAFVFLLPILTTTFGAVVKSIEFFREKLEKVLSYIPGFQSTSNKDPKTGEVTTTNPARTFSSLITVAAAAAGAFYLKKRLMAAMKMEARVVNITTQSVTGLGGLGDALGGGSGGPPGAGRKGIFKGFREDGLRGGFRNMFSGASSLLKPGNLLKMVGGGALKLAGRGIIGAVFTGLFDSFLNIFGEFKGKKSLSSMASYAGIGGTIGSFIPIPFVGTLIGALVGGLVGLIVENFDDLNISSMIEGAWHGAKWVADVFNGMMDWIAKQFRDALPPWLQHVLGVPDAPTAQAPGATPQAGASDGVAMLKSLLGIPQTAAVSAPNDSDESLNKRLVDVMAQTTIDQKKQQDGDRSDALQLQILKDIQEQMQISNALLHRGNNQREDGNRRSAVQQ